MNTQATNEPDIIEELCKETDELQARIVGLSSILAALVVTHPDREELSRYIAHVRQGLVNQTPDVLKDSLNTQAAIDMALATIDWFDKMPAPK